MDVVEMSLEYWNKLANQFIMISSLLGGFSIAVTANLLVYKSNNRITINLLKSSTIAAGSFLVTVFSMTKILMMTFPGGYFKNVVQSDFILPRVIGILSFILGIASLSILISLSGWTKSKSAGIFTTVVGALTFLMISIMMV